LSVLENEFEELREKSSHLVFWNTLFWEHEAVALSDWILVDAWYRSRCLELPVSGDSMVPVLDMVNHSHEPTAYYEQGSDGDVQLFPRSGTNVVKAGEITISYGAGKPAAEMLFSYGFIDTQTAGRALTLPVEPLEDDPLAKAKLHLFKQPGVVKLFEQDGVWKWQSPFAFLVCLNEEDGLDFRVLQDTQGNRQLKLFWQGEDATAQTQNLEDLLGSHPMCQVIRLRVITIILERVAAQLENVKLDISEDDVRPLLEDGTIRQEIFDSAQCLRELEVGDLEKAIEMLENEVRHVNPTCPPPPLASHLLQSRVGVQSRVMPLYRCYARAFCSTSQGVFPC
jgi:hypothetical protein